MVGVRLGAHHFELHFSQLLNAAISAIGIIPGIGDGIAAAWATVTVAVAVAKPTGEATALITRFAGTLSAMAAKAGPEVAAQAGKLIDRFSEAAMTLVGRMGKGGTKSGAEAIEGLQKAGIIRNLKGTTAKGTEGHHLLPDQFRAQFEAIEGVGNIDNYKALLDVETHQACHGAKAIFGRGGKWNAEWQNWFNKMRRSGHEPSRDDVLNKLWDMLQNFEPVWAR